MEVGREDKWDLREVMGSCCGVELGPMSGKNRGSPRKSDEFLTRW